MRVCVRGRVRARVRVRIRVRARGHRGCAAASPSPEPDPSPPSPDHAPPLAETRRARACVREFVSAGGGAVAGPSPKPDPPPLPPDQSPAHHQNTTRRLPRLTSHPLAGHCAPLIASSSPRRGAPDQSPAPRRNTTRRLRLPALRQPASSSPRRGAPTSRQLLAETLLAASASRLCSSSQRHTPPQPTCRRLAEHDPPPPPALSPALRHYVAAARSPALRRNATCRLRRPNTLQRPANLRAIAVQLLAHWPLRTLLLG